MATKKVTQLATATSAADLDLVMIVDVADTAMSPEGTNKQITKANLLSGVGGGSEIGITNIRGFTQNKTGSPTNWMGYHHSFYPLMSIDFQQTSTADFDITWTEIVAATVYHATSATPSLVEFEGNLITNASVDVDLSLWYVRPLCAGSSKGTMKHIVTKSFTTSSNVYECFSGTLSQSLLKGDIIIPLIKTSDNNLVKFTGTFRTKQL
ncbi:MAG: hypothetical protein Unbinned2250contig1000_3 [Prokaryotic dsDNA virus sp.]|nr:MAG: hypothetical protein Unbinned2250contig1000_3 [Prokaryotic dsDNA virus sp.]|tara:strand:- start:612 stop:1238 length:627 start_codon:yes stop_codon:yes gene_type:complete